ncbi:olfactory receptor 6C4-like [Pseudophryne corroboree]|uniref:olfactory receptor 6C4-like n=1 Tax=Pseudophryne corroboree TaxID=495146 RepID=UPI0030815B16
MGLCLASLKVQVSALSIWFQQRLEPLADVRTILQVGTLDITSICPSGCSMGFVIGSSGLTTDSFGTLETVVKSDPFAGCTLENRSWTNEFLLLGFTNERDKSVILFIFFFLIYIMTLLGNITIISLATVEITLRTPMYFFLNNFSYLEIGYTTTTVPRMLYHLLSGNMAISFNSCLTQMYFFFVFGTTEFFILALMGFDRYLAICHPLHYTTIMNKQFCYQLVLGSWVSGCLVPTVPTIVLSRKPFCGSKIINHFFCDVGPLVKLSSPDTFFLDVFVFMISAVVVLSSLLLITISYVFIISAILRISSSSGRHKAFSTCASHFSVVTIFFGTVIFMYVRPSSVENYQMDKAVSVFYSVVTPALNPLIYSLRNNEVKRALRKVFQRRQKSLESLGVIYSIKHKANFRQH